MNLQIFIQSVNKLGFSTTVSCNDDCAVCNKIVNCSPDGPIGIRSTFPFLVLFLIGIGDKKWCNLCKISIYWVRSFDKFCRLLCVMLYHWQDWYDISDLHSLLLVLWWLFDQFPMGFEIFYFLFCDQWLYWSGKDSGYTVVWGPVDFALVESMSVNFTECSSSMTKLSFLLISLPSTFLSPILDFLEVASYIASANSITSTTFFLWASNRVSRDLFQD